VVSAAALHTVMLRDRPFAALGSGRYNRHRNGGKPIPADPATAMSRGLIVKDLSEKPGGNGQDAGWPERPVARHADVVTDMNFGAGGD